MSVHRAMYDKIRVSWQVAGHRQYRQYTPCTGSRYMPCSKRCNEPPTSSPTSPAAGAAATACPAGRSTSTILTDCTKDIYFVYVSKDRTCTPCTPACKNGICTTIYIIYIKMYRQIHICTALCTRVKATSAKRSTMYAANALEPANNMKMPDLYVMMYSTTKNTPCPPCTPFVGSPARSGVPSLPGR